MRPCEKELTQQSHYSTMFREHRNHDIMFELSICLTSVQRKIVIIFLPIIFSICFGCSKEPSHRDGSFEYLQHMVLLRNKKIIFLLRTLN